VRICGQEYAACSPGLNILFFQSSSLSRSLIPVAVIEKKEEDAELLGSSFPPIMVLAMGRRNDSFLFK